MADVVSVIVPIYNVEKFLRQCLDSIVNQTYRDLEIFLIDDGSPDNCGEICDEYAAIDNRIIVIHKENAGVSAARNDGIDRATGKWIMFVDPDDWLELDCCSRVIEIAKRNETDIIYFQREDNSEEGSVAYKLPKSKSRVLDVTDLKRLQFDNLAGNCESFGFASASPWGILYNKDFLKKNRCSFPLGVKRRQDLLFNLYCLEYAQSAYYFDYVGYHYRLRNASICRRYNRNMMDILLDYLGKIEEFVTAFHNKDDLYIRMIGVQAINIHGDLRLTQFFHISGFMPFKEYRTYMNDYYASPIVKKYLNKPKISDFRTLKDKMCYFLISRHHVCLYYYIFAILKKIKGKVYMIGKRINSAKNDSR